MNELYPEVLTEKSVKHWSEYFSLCKACFAPLDGEVYGVGHFVFRKR
jgi:cyclopropane-fatty-acyl-phospholipid synthase